MAKDLCRLCGSPLKNNDYLEIKNTPSIIQNLSRSKLKSKKQKLTLKITKCLNCDLTQLTNEPVKYFRSVIRASGLSEEMGRLKKTQIEDFTKKFNLNKKTKAVEIGCGSGEYLSILNKYFDNPLGLEFDKKQIQLCQKKGLRTSKGFISNQNYNLKKEKMEAFFIFNFLEHIPNPLIFLKGLINNLADKSFGVIEVPNYEYMLKNKITYDYTPEHLSYFTKKTLKSALTMAGLNVLSVREIWHHHILEAIVTYEKIQDYAPSSEFIRKTDGIYSKIDDLINKTHKSGFVVWGACHHSFFVLSQIKNYNKINCIVDSATYKENKYSPVTSIKILSPKFLHILKPDSLLIMASSYSLEILKIIRRDYSFIKNVYLLQETIIKKIE
jgi:hypothetical protein